MLKVKSIKATGRLLGRRLTLWAVGGVVAGGCLAVVEIGIALSLQALLTSLGLVEVTGGEPGLGASVLENISSIALLSLFVILMFSRGFLSSFVQQNANYCRDGVLARLKLLSVYEFLKTQRGFGLASKLHARLGDDFPYAVNFIQGLVIALPNALLCLVLLGSLYFYSWQQATVGLVGVAFIGIIIVALNRYVRQSASQVPREHEALIQGIERVGRNWLLVKALRTSQQEYVKFVSNILNYFRHVMRARFFAVLAGALPLSLGGVLMAIMIGLHLNVWSGLVSSATFMGFLYLFVRFVQILAAVARAYGNLNALRAHFRRAIGYANSFTDQDLEEATTFAQTVGFSGTASSWVPEQGDSDHRDSSKLVCPSIKVDNLAFSFEGGPYLFKNLSFEVASGSQFGVIGRSGAGKSTLLALMMGVIEPSKGRVSIDSRSAKEYLDDPCVRLGFVGAEPFLIEGSVKENLLYGAKGFFEERDFIESLKKAHLWDRIQSKPGGLNYCINPADSGLSAGEQQRLSLARAFLSRPHLLILDEASANLDVETEAQLADSLLNVKGETTVIIVSHRKGLLKNVDDMLDFNLTRGTPFSTGSSVSGVSIGGA